MLTRSRTVAAPEAAVEIARMEKVSDAPCPTTAADTAPKRDPTNTSSGWKPGTEMSPKVLLQTSASELSYH